ncbi:hypothetical protein SOVF_059830 [Spinacia oleracea]|nr:hypothetical protein SOVF_059830 [Spinacia oleracea]
MLDTPFGDDDNGASASGGQNGSFQMNPSMIKAICNEVMKAMKGKQPANNSGAHSVAFANSAGISFECSISCNLVFGDSWIIDSGATDHMTYNAKLFKSRKTLKIPIPICLPDAGSNGQKLGERNPILHIRHLGVFSKTLTAKLELPNYRAAAGQPPATVSPVSSATPGWLPMRVVQAHLL